MAPLAEKRCVTCREVKPTEAFYRNRCITDGLNPRCIACDKAYKRSRYAETRVRRRERYHADAEYRGRVIAWAHDDRARRVSRARAFYASVIAETPCRRCGGKPVDFHNEDHRAIPRRRVGFMVASGRTPTAIADEIASCAALCRRCHMTEDGRLARLKAAQPLQKGTSLPPKHCANCERPYKPMRRGLCGACYRRTRQSVSV